MEWINVADEMPPNGYEVMYVGISKTAMVKRMIGYHIDDQWYYSCFFSYTKLLPTIQVTYWCDLLPLTHSCYSF